MNEQIQSTKASDLSKNQSRLKTDLFNLIGKSESYSSTARIALEHCEIKFMDSDQRAEFLHEINAVLLMLKNLKAKLNEH